MTKCKTCQAPVNLAPDGDPKYDPPRMSSRLIWHDCVIKEPPKDRTFFVSDGNDISTVSFDEFYANYFVFESDGDYLYDNRNRQLEWFPSEDFWADIPDLPKIGGKEDG